MACGVFAYALFSSAMPAFQAFSGVGVAAIRKTAVAVTDKAARMRIAIARRKTAAQSKACSPIGKPAELPTLVAREIRWGVNTGHESDTRAVDLPHLCGPFECRCIERALSAKFGKRPDRAFHCLRSADPDRLRQRSSDGARGSRKGRRTGKPSGRHACPLRRPAARSHEYVDDD